MQARKKKETVEEGQKKPKTPGHVPADARWKKKQCFESSDTDHFARNCAKKGLVVRQCTKPAVHLENRPAVARVAAPALESTTATADGVGCQRHLSTCFGSGFTKELK